MEVGLALEGSNIGVAERILLSSFELAAGALLECDLGYDRDEQLLVTVVRIAPGSDPRISERLRFWCARAGGRAVSLTDAPSPEPQLWERRLASCASRIRSSSYEALARAFRALRVGRANGPPAGDAGALALEVDLSGPGSEGIAYNSDEGLLFIPGVIAPPTGDEFDLVVRARGSPQPLRSRARVAEVRRSEAAVPGAPAGFVLELGSASAAMSAALEGCCSWMNTDAMVVEARRAAPRYPVCGPVEIAIAGPACAEGAFGSSPAAQIVNLSVGGAFIETPRPLPAGSRIRIRAAVGVTESFETDASVVFASATGIGVKFHLDGLAEASLARLLARVCARPRRALLVDDDVLARQILGDALRERGFEVLTAQSGEAALQALARELFSLDVLVTDLRMTGIDGGRLVEAASGARKHVDIAVVAVSGRLDGDVAERLRAAGADAVLDKVLGPERIAQEADHAIEARSRRLPPARPGGRASANE